MVARFKWFFVFAAVLVTAGGGLLLGKMKETDYMSAIYERRDFTLLDDQGNFFTLSEVPAKTLTLLIFTPDALPVDSVKPFHAFAARLGELKKMGIEPMLVSRINREIVLNFKRATRFEPRLLLDLSGTVGRNAGVWEGADIAPFWGYSLVDNRFRVLWHSQAAEPLTMDQLKADLEGAK